MRIHHSAWPLFAPHHYLTASLAHGAVCFGAFWLDELVAFDAWLPFVGRLGHSSSLDRRKGYRDHRTVVLPDYQGVSIGQTLCTTIASMWRALEYHAYSGTGHPAEIATRYKRQDLWRIIRHGIDRTRSCHHSVDRSHTRDRRILHSEYIGPPMDVALANRLLDRTAWGGAT